jgi:hypothetical protein
MPLPPRRRGLALACLLPLLLLPACASVDNRSVRMTEETVLPITGGEAADVSAPVLAAAMLRAGFSADEVLRHGPALHSALATSGSAQVRQKRVVGAIFAVHADKLYVTSRTRGTFMTPIVGPEAAAIGPASVAPSDPEL